MCTLTLYRGEDGLRITMNRDEARWRAAELEPRVASGAGGGPQWAAPGDGAQGGTWIGVNADGVAAAILNAYAPGDAVLRRRADGPSRGGIITRLLARSQIELEGQLAALDPQPYPSFTLLVVTVCGAELIEWRRDRGLRRAPVGEGWTLLSSSAWRTEEVLEWRRLRFHTWCEAGCPMVDGVPTYNLLEVAGRETHSPMMRRPFSATRSVSQVLIKRRGATASLRYWRRGRRPPVTIERPDAELHLPLTRPWSAVGETSP